MVGGLHRAGERAIARLQHRQLAWKTAAEVIPKELQIASQFAQLLNSLGTKPVSIVS